MDSKPVKAEGLDINQSDDGFVVYDPRNDKVHFLNHTAVMILELCQGNLNAAEIAELMAKTYGLDSNPVTEVKGALEQLVDEGLIKSV